MLDKTLLETIGFDRIMIEVGIAAIDSTKMGNALYGLSYADERDNLYLEVTDHADGEVKKIKTMCAIYTTDGAVKVGDMTDTDTDSVKYGIRIKHSQNNLLGEKAEKRMMVVLDIVSGRIAYDTTHNVYNLHDSELAVSMIDRVVRELAINGIYISSPDTWEIITAEVNKTIKTELSMKEYEPVFDWLFAKLFESGAYRRRTDNKKRLKDLTESRTYSCLSRKEAIKVYDKTAQMKDTMNIHLEDNLIRFEVTWNRENLKRRFKRTRADISILSDMDLLHSNFYGVLDGIIEIIKGAIDNEVAALSSLYKKTGRKEIKRIYSENASTIFDNLIFMKAAHSYYKSCKNSNFSKDTKGLIDGFDKRLNHRIEKLIFILSILAEKEPDIIKLNKTLRQYL